MLQALLRKNAPHRALHVYDSFEGLPAGDATKDDPPAYRRKAGSMRADVEDVLENFQALDLPPPSKIHKGWFCDTTLTDDNPKKIAFAHLDGDLYQSILESLEFVYPRMDPGGIAVIDDYCDPDTLNRHDIFPGALRACQEFFKDKPESVVVLPAPHPGYKYPMQYEAHAYFQKL